MILPSQHALLRSNSSYESREAMEEFGLKIGKSVTVIWEIPAVSWKAVATSSLYTETARAAFQSKWCRKLDQPFKHKGFKAKGMMFTTHTAKERKEKVGTVLAKVADTK